MTEAAPTEPRVGPYIYLRLAAALALMTTGGAGLYAVIVALKPMAAEFEISRSSISVAYAVTTLGFGLGGIVMGKLSDRVGVMVPILFGSASLALGFYISANATSIWQVYLAQGLFVGFLGNSTVFAPLVADVTHWFTKRRGMAVAIVFSGNYLTGVVWSPIVQYGIDLVGWRQTFEAIGLVCLIVMPPLCLVLYRRAPHLSGASSGHAALPARPLEFEPNTLHCVLCVAGIACCIAMAVPQAHIVAHVSDLGYAAARGAEMLAVVLGGGVISRLAFGAISDRVGGVMALLLGSGLQAATLVVFMFVDGLLALYVASALFGLSQGGIVPAYAIIVRTYFPSADAGWRIGTVLFFTLAGMAIGGWLAGLLYDLTGSYQVAFANAVFFNVMNTTVAYFLLRRSRRFSPSHALVG